MLWNKAKGNTVKVLLDERKCTELIEEMNQLVWDQRSDVEKEDSRCANHLTDAMLYAWRFCYQWLSEMPDRKPKVGSKEWMKQQEIEHEEMLIRELEQKQSNYGLN